MEFWLSKFFWILVGSFIGAGLNFLVPYSLWDTKWVKNLRKKLNFNKSEEKLNIDNKNLNFGSLQINNIAKFQRFYTPLLQDEIISKPTVSTWRELPPDLQELKSTWLPQKLDSLKGKTKDNNNLYSLNRLSILRPDTSGARKNTIELQFEPTDFFNFLMINDSLSVETTLVKFDNTKESIKDRYNLMPKSFDWADLNTIPFHMWVATVTAVVTSDGYLVVPVRSKGQAISDSSEGTVEHLSLSCAEGMLRPIDSTSVGSAEIPSPFLTSIRSLDDELNLKIGEAYIKNDLKLLGLGFDSQRYQTVFVFFLQLPNVDFYTLKQNWKHAKDVHENKDILYIKPFPADFAQILCNKFDKVKNDLGETMISTLFSNHQKFGMLLTALHILESPIDLEKAIDKVLNS